MQKTKASSTIMTEFDAKQLFYPDNMKKSHVKAVTEGVCKLINLKDYIRPAGTTMKALEEYGGLIIDAV